jgi:hypothetical protein
MQAVWNSPLVTLYEAIRVRVNLECPPLEDTGPLLNDILRSRGRGRIGALTMRKLKQWRVC